jgi:hypothetical protein
VDQATTIAWIFLAVGLASQKSAADRSAISQLADGINHAVPTHEEMETSLSFLTTAGLISVQNGKFSLSITGAAIYKKVFENELPLLSAWKLTTEEISRLA